MKTKFNINYNEGSWDRKIPSLAIVGYNNLGRELDLEAIAKTTGWLKYNKFNTASDFMKYLDGLRGANYEFPNNPAFLSRIDLLITNAGYGYEFDSNLNQNIPDSEKEFLSKLSLDKIDSKTLKKNKNFGLQGIKLVEKLQGEYFVDRKIVYSSNQGLKNQIESFGAEYTNLIGKRHPVKDIDFGLIDVLRNNHPFLFEKGE